MQTVKLNMTPSGVMPHLYCSRYDVGREFALVIYDASGTYQIPAGAVARLHGRKEDNKLFTYGSDDKEPVIKVDSDNSKVTFKTTEQMTSSVGITIMELIITTGSGDTEKTIASLNFILDVEQNVLPDDGKTSATDLETYQQMIDAAKDAKVTANDAQEIVKAYGIKARSISLLAPNWQGTDKPYYYDLGSEYEGSGTLLAISNDATDVQLATWRNAEIYGGVGTKLYARNMKPAVDLPVILIYAPIRRVS